MAVNISQSIYGTIGRRQRRQVRNLTRNRQTKPVQTAIQGKTPVRGPAAAPSAPKLGPLPPKPAFNPAYDSALAAIDQRYGNLAGQYQYGTTALSQAYGFDEQGREITDPSNVLFNPFNRMKLLRESFQTANKATSGSMASRGQLYSGALQSRLDNNRGQFDQNQDTLQRDYMSGRQQLLSAWLEGQDELARLRAEAEQGNLDFQLENRPEESAEPVPQGTKGYLWPGLIEHVQRGDAEKGISNAGILHEKRTLKPTGDPPKGYRWVKVNGKWTLRRKR